MKSPVTANLLRLAIALAVVCSLGICDLQGQVRTKKPDRGTYQPPTISRTAATSKESNEQPDDLSDRLEASLGEILRRESPNRQEASPEHHYDDFFGEEEEFLSEAEPLPIDDRSRRRMKNNKTSSSHKQDNDSRLKRVGHEEVVLSSPRTGEIVREEVIHEGSEFWPDPIAPHHSEYAESLPVDGSYIEGEYYDDGYYSEGVGCDANGCDSIGIGFSNWSNANLAFSHDRWFGSMELLLMWRKGDHIPPLLTTGDPADTNPGALDQAGTAVLVGREKILDDLTAGGRFTLGTWIDDCCSRSLVIRAWFAGEDEFDFVTDQNQFPVLTRPFFDVALTPAEENTQLIALPGRTQLGQASVSAASEVYGGDLSVRQLAYSRFGGTVDLLYGYQYMRMSESLSTFSRSMDANDGTFISVTDSFETENVFHGAQFGVSTHYREGCWSFRGLIKVAAGSLRRERDLRGETVTQAADTFVDPNGLLVRSTNRGSQTEHTFGWVPELDVSLGYHYFPRFEVTAGYHVIGMTDAVQVSGLIDPDLASNLSDPLTEPFRPTPMFRDTSFYVHGIHFGLEYVY